MYIVYDYLEESITIYQEIYAPLLSFLEKIDILMYRKNRNVWLNNKDGVKK